MSSFRERILSNRKMPTEPVGSIPEWGITAEDGLVIRGLSAKERDVFEQSRLEQKGKTLKLNMTNTRARLVALALIGPDGKRVFSDDDVAELGDLAGEVVDRLFQTAQRLSGMSDKDVEEDVEALRKNHASSSPTA